MKKTPAIIIPTYREADNLKNLIPGIYKNLKNAYVIVVDDNSPDNTKSVVTSLKKKYPTLALIMRNKKDGRGSAVLEGFKYASQKTPANVFIEMDADFSHDPIELPKMVDLSIPRHVVIASRYIKGSQLVYVAFNRKLLSIMSNVIIRFLLKMPLTDNTNGFRAYQKDALNELFKHRFESKGYIVLSESAYLLKRKGFSFIETPSVFVNRRVGESNATLLEFTSSIKNILKIQKQK